MSTPEECNHAPTVLQLRCPCGQFVTDTSLADNMTAQPMTKSEAHLALGRLLRCLPDDLGRCPVCDGLGGWHTAHCGLVAQARADIKGAKP